MPPGEASFDVQPGHVSYRDQSGFGSAEETRAVRRAGPGADLALLTEPQDVKAFAPAQRSQVCLLPALPERPSSQGLPSARRKAGGGEI